MIDPNLRSSSDREWLLYASFELTSPSGAVLITAERLQSLLVDTLQPLGLAADFSERVLAAVRESVSRIPVEMAEVWLLVYTPDPHPANGKTWGFFRTMKNKAPNKRPAGSRQEIAFYLYVEGHPTAG